MNISHPHRIAARRGPASRRSTMSRTGRGQVLRVSLLLATIGAVAVMAGPAAMAAPSAPAVAAAGKPKPTPQPTASADSISWSVSPASATAPDHRSSFSYTNVKPGSAISDHVAVLNRSSQSVAFTLYGTDATGTTATNTLMLLASGKQPTQVGAWTRFEHNLAEVSVIIPAGKGVIEPFSVTVPRNANPGDHLGAMVAQVTVLRRTRAGTSFNETERIAVPIVLRVVGPLHASLLVESVSVSYAGRFNPLNDGLATVTYAVQNTGNVLLAGSQNVSVSGPFGAVTAKLRSLPVVLPGDSVRITTTAGFLYGMGPVTAHVRIAPAAAPHEPALATPLAEVTASASTFAVPWAILLILVVAVGGIVGFTRWLRYRQRQLQAHVNAVAEGVRRETEQRLLGSRKSPPPGQA
jgi:hypothetical protein